MSQGSSTPPSTSAAPLASPPTSNPALPAPQRHLCLIAPIPADWGDELDFSTPRYAGLTVEQALAQGEQTFVFAFNALDSSKFIQRLTQESGREGAQEKKEKGGAQGATDGSVPELAKSPTPNAPTRSGSEGGAQGARPPRPHPSVRPFERYAQVVTITSEPPPGRRKRAPAAEGVVTQRVIYVERVRLLAVEEVAGAGRVAVVENARVRDDAVDTALLRERRKALGAQLLERLNAPPKEGEGAGAGVGEEVKALKKVAEEAAGRRPFLKWSLDLFDALDPDDTARVLWLQCNSSSERMTLLHMLALERVASLGAEAEIQRNMTDMFSLTHQRNNIRRRMMHLAAILRNLERRQGELSGGEGEGDDTRAEMRARFMERMSERGERGGFKDPWGQEEEGESKTLEERLGALSLTPEVRREVRRALKALRGTMGMGPETHSLKGFLELVCELPWERRAEERAVSFDEVASALDARHEGLAEVKERVLEHLAVSRLSGEPQGTVLCLSGPPGVGKTTLVREVASALGRPFVRVSLGGVHDEADIRGHRRTYVSSVPGRICDALRLAKVKNPVVLLDEIDKLGEGRRGSPEAALLEVLDPEQNKAFRDHYLEVPLDLSEVLFICTANDPRTLSAPLRDRLEMVELSGYSDAEKLKIARDHLIPHAIKRHGLAEGALSLSDEVLTEVIARYTKEAGVRQLERAVSRLCRKLALRTARAPEGAPAPRLAPSADDLVGLLGAPKFSRERVVPLLAPGVVNGLAWTAAGGSVLHIEAARYKGKGALKLTGRLGEVMQESAQAALTALRVRRGDELEASHDFDARDIHIHLPDGAVPKDGPSAGVALYCVLYSLMSGRALREDVAMTGECTLQGRVLAVGGLREKLLGAQRDQMRRVILPRQNQAEVMAFEPAVRGDLDLVWVDLVDQALEAALPSAVEPLSASDELDASWDGADELQAQGGALLFSSHRADQDD